MRPSNLLFIMSGEHGRRTPTAEDANPVYT